MIEIVKHSKVPNPKLQLFCFHYAGGGANFFKNWPNYLDSGIEVNAIRLPGRESLSFYKPYTSLDPLVLDLFSIISPVLKFPFILFGHSMGSLIAFELARKLENSGYYPSHLYLSACGHPNYIVKKQRHLLTDNELTSSILSHPKLNLINEKYKIELLPIILPTIRADYTIYDTYQYQPSAKLYTSITALGGNVDYVHHKKLLRYWRTETCSQFFIKIFHGDHFYIDTCLPELLNIINLRSDSLENNNSLNKTNNPISNNSFF